MSESLCKHKYFRTIWPTKTREKCEDAIENYLFEVLYTKLFKIDEDSRAFAQQLKDRLYVLKQIVTFDMLDIPAGMRDKAIFDMAVKGRVNRR